MNPVAENSSIGGGPEAPDQVIAIFKGDSPNLEVRAGDKNFGPFGREFPEPPSLEGRKDMALLEVGTRHAVEALAFKVPADGGFIK